MFTKDSAGQPFSLEAQINVYAVFAHAALQRTAELVELNLALGRDSLRESADGQKRLLAAADASQYTALSSVLVRENLERGMCYVRDFAAIVTKTYTANPAAAGTGVKATSKAV